ncbi:putative cytochrome P450 alkane hydroxylase [Saccharata proteae CBS 121410]|uniref:Cytochrome P450 alkane hydroxylase n=1 Tax=Saccharata proteae CBS 121410 TaxID=1314787 RepID=A0A9P4HPX5_9PEZI|nr:putative cytochrome P450 alkane hydroxylase [Saccharata proteae CBS 121410]
MSRSSSVLYAAIAALAFVFCLRVVSSFFRRRILIQKHGCRQPSKMAHSDPVLGSDRMLESYRNLKQHTYLDMARNRFLQFGNTFEANLLGTRNINTIEPKNIQNILATNFESFDYGHRRRRAFQRLLGKSIFAVDGSQWLHSRKMLKPSFNKQEVGETEALEIYVQDLIKAVPQNGSTFDLQDLFFRFTMDVGTEKFFGESCHSLRAGDDKSLLEFEEAFNRTQRTIANDAALGPFDIFNSRKKFQKDCKIVHGFVQSHVDRVLGTELSRLPHEDLEKSGESSCKRRHVVLEELARETQDPVQLRSEMMSLIVASRDTTGCLLSNLWFVLTRSPQIWGKLREEICQLQDRQPSFEELKQLKYLQACIKETLRLYPSIPINSRTSNKDTVLPVGGGRDGKWPIFLARGTVVGFNIWAMHRRKDIYGPDAEDFRPERWEQQRPGWHYLPFNGGPRSCLGQQMAMTEAAYVTVRLVQSFPMIESRDSEPWQELLTAACSSRRGTLVGLQQEQQHDRGFVPA